MSICDRLSDRMPAVALGRERWNAGAERHLAVCDDCRAEWELILAARRLGATAPRLDHAALVTGLGRQFAERPCERPGRWRRAWGSGLAAAGIAALLWAGFHRSDAGPSTMATTEAAAPAESLTDAQVDSLLQSDDEPLPGWSMLESPGLGDLNEDELEQVLRTWEG